jgi:hypothetical protein
MGVCKKSLFKSDPPTETLSFAGDAEDEEKDPTVDLFAESSKLESARH